MSVKPQNVTNANNRPFLLASSADLGREVWARYDEGAELYALCASADMDDPIGEADSITDAHRVAAWWFDELRSA
ncbi:TPA: hypothetical protein ACPWIG_005190 [Pseudomonas aeruginosa]|uniref:hypothetical protein n=1 Tax=Pseudomonas aeruginosa TaxID=287 RepID=UPI00273402D0|nr:hypothetical protein [Pseudomonas aeruginosa]MDP2556135.1 hypothetical protein [Pseudomonas aeruginosa]